MLTQGVDTDRQRHQDPGGRDDGVEAHADQHDHGAQLVDILCRKHIQRSQDKDQEQTGQFPEEFREAAVQLSHLNDLRQVVVKNTFIDAVTEAHGEQ